MKSKTTAALLALFLGFLGVHRFYLKQFWLGILYLITLGFYGIGALIDFIMFISMRDERFDEKYNSKYLNYQEEYSEPINTNTIQKVEEPIKIITLPNVELKSGELDLKWWQIKIITLPNVEKDIEVNKIFENPNPITENKPYHTNAPSFKVDKKKAKGCFFLIFASLIFIGWLGTCFKKPQEKAQETVYDMNKSVRVGDVQYLIKNAFTRKHIGTDYYEKDAGKGMCFIQIELLCGNLTNEPINISHMMFYLVDDNGAKYETDNGNLLSLELQTRLAIINCKVNPNTAQHGYIVFEVPADKEYKLVASGGLWSNKTAKFYLYSSN